MSQKVQDYRYHTLFIQKVEGSYAQFQAEIPQTSETRSLGLMHRQDISPDYAMIFIYPPRGFKSVWMQNVLISLDVIFFRDGIITQILHSLQPLDSTSHMSMDKVDGFIEIKGGEALKNNLRVGDKIFID